MSTTITTNTNHTLLGSIGDSTADTGQGQSFTATQDGIVDFVTIYLVKVLTPTQTMKAAIQTNASSNPGTVLDSKTLAAADITSAADNTFTFPVGANVTNGTVYWLTMIAGAIDASNYYQNVGNNNGYTGVGRRYWDGTTWTGGADVNVISTTIHIADVADVAGSPLHSRALMGVGK